jgi:hypothetical protein
VAEYVDHYHGERNHQGLGGRLIALTFAPEVRAQCGSAARWDLCGGRSEPC